MMRRTIPIKYSRMDVTNISALVHFPILEESLQTSTSASANHMNVKALRTSRCLICHIHVAINTPICATVSTVHLYQTPMTRIQDDLTDGYTFS